MKISSKALRILAFLFIIFCAFFVGFSVALSIFHCGNYPKFLSSLPIILAGISIVFGFAARRKKDQELKNN